MREGWTYQGRTAIDEINFVDRYTHTSGAFVDDNTHNVPADLVNEPEVVADTNFVGNRTNNDWEQFPTLEDAMTWAIADPDNEIRGHN